jgi:hypothetical protein
MQTNLATARFMHIVLGMWLMLSAFFWPDGLAQRLNTCISGLLCATGALVLVRVPKIRHLIGILAVHVFVSSWLFASSLGSLLNNVLVATAMFFAAVLPGYVQAGTARPSRLNV